MVHVAPVDFVVPPIAVRWIETQTGSIKVLSAGLVLPSITKPTRHGFADMIGTAFTSTDGQATKKKAITEHLHHTCNGT